MITNAALTVTDNEWQITGELTFQTVRSLWEESKKLLSANAKLIVDLNQVMRCDSAGLALLIEWKRLAMQKQCAIRFKNLPVALSNIAKVSNLLEILQTE